MLRLALTEGDRFINERIERNQLKYFGWNEDTWHDSRHVVRTTVCQCI